MDPPPPPPINTRYKFRPTAPGWLGGVTTGWASFLSNRQRHWCCHAQFCTAFFGRIASLILNWMAFIVQLFPCRVLLAEADVDALQILLN